MTYQTQLTLKSGNAKTGPIPVSTTTFSTCPGACPLKSNGCYAQSGPLGMHWRKVTEGKRGGDFGAFLDQIAALPPHTLWRHNQAGDLPGDQITVDATALADLVNANAGKHGFTYTHYDVLRSADNRRAVAAANAGGFTVNLSGNDMAHADALADTGAGPVVVILPASVEGRQNLATPAGRRVVVCPATYLDDTSCATCGLCQRQRDVIVGFPAHGASVLKADAIARATLRLGPNERRSRAQDIRDALRDIDNRRIATLARRKAHRARVRRRAAAGTAR